MDPRREALPECGRPGKVSMAFFRRNLAHAAPLRPRDASARAAQRKIHRSMDREPHADSHSYARSMFWLPEDGFEVYRQAPAHPWVLIARLAPKSTSFADTTVLSLATYIYRVRAYNRGGPSA